MNPAGAERRSDVPTPPDDRQRRMLAEFNEQVEMWDKALHHKIAARHRERSVWNRFFNLFGNR